MSRNERINCGEACASGFVCVVDNLDADSRQIDCRMHACVCIPSVANRAKAVEIPTGQLVVFAFSINSVMVKGIVKGTLKVASLLDSLLTRLRTCNFR